VALASTALTWYVARAGGLLAFALVSLSVILGLALAGRVRSRRWPAFAIEDVHRYLGLLAGAFIAIHGLALLVDGYVNFNLGALLVPGAAPTRVVPVAFGVLAAELLAALAVTNHYRRRIPHHVWRRLHYANFAVWALALVHGITAGTDTSSTWVVVMYAVSAGAVLGLLAWRVLRTRAVERWELRLWPAATAVAAGQLVIAMTLGPLAIHAA
jgi:predicted ferric reductase